MYESRMVGCRIHWLSIAVLLTLTAACSNLPLPPVPSSVSASSSSSNSGSSSGSFGAAASAVSSQLTFNPSTFSFPSTAIGTTSSILTVVTLTNNAGGSAIQLTDITSSNPSEFPLTTTCSVPGALAPGTTCLVSIQFRPNSAGARSAQITVITTNAGRVSAAVSGSGALAAVPQITITPESFSFPNTVVGSTSFTGGVVTLTNTGTTAVALTTITSPDVTEFPITTTCNLPGSLAPGASCTVSVQFRPSAIGNRSAQMTIVTNVGPIGTFSVFGAGF
jgi:hypothetical protein